MNDESISKFIYYLNIVNDFYASLIYKLLDLLELLSHVDVKRMSLAEEDVKFALA
jgi:hypothetical protein